mmetsp:Transcript_3406/g.2012  ORF Transcript_3406/g.2012 Transcript_3406/m.2012 type:complete len:795 (+) Transcript_3406:143-2527(+)
MAKYNLENNQLSNGRIGKVAILGSGIMGGGIAAAYTGAGIPVLLLDMSIELVKNGLEAVQCSKPKLFMSSADASLINISTFDELDLVKDCDVIVEVIIEDLKIKQQLLGKVAKKRKQGSIVCTNTSGISLKDICEGLPEEFQQHFIGTHFFNPVRYMKLLEIIPCPKTLPEVVRFMSEFGEKRLGKGIVVANDVPGFVGNRIGVQGLAVSMQKMQEHSLTIPEVDALLGKAIGRPKTGVFKTSDLVGIDTASMVVSYLYQTCKDDVMRDSFQLPPFVHELVKKGNLGKKTRKAGGFYKTEKNKNNVLVRSVVDPVTLEYDSIEKADFSCLTDAKRSSDLNESVKAIIYGSDKGATYAREVIFKQLVYAATMVGIVGESIIEIDNAMKWGYNFTMGPFELWDALGLEKSVDIMEKESIAIPTNIKDMLSKGTDFFYKFEEGKKLFFNFKTGQYEKIKIEKDHISLSDLKRSGNTVIGNDSASLVDGGDGVFIFEIHSNIVNAINGDVIECLNKALDYVAQNGVGFVIGNDHDFFSAGADLGLILNAINKKDLASINDMVKSLQEAVFRIKYINFPVVAAVRGMALGGGCELVLSADRTIANPNTFIGLVEMGVGVVPAGGGCTNLYSRILKTIPDSIKDNDISKYLEAAFTNITMAKVSSSAKNAMELGFFLPTDKIVPNRSNLFSVAKKEVLHMIEDNYVPPVPKPLRVMGQDGFGMLNVAIMMFEKGGFVAPHSAKVARGVARILTGGDRGLGMIDEKEMLALEREVFIELCQNKITVDKMINMITTGKPLIR